MTDVHETIEGYLARLDAALRELHEREREELLAEVRAHLEEAAAESAEPDTAVAKAVRSLGDPRRLAERLREGDAEAPAPERVKRVLGMPYNFRLLSAEEIASRLWNPSDPRIFMPRIFGIGWTLNFGAIAVRLGLVRPDDEEPVPFASVPGSALNAGLAAVTLVNVAALAVAALVRSPRPLPTQWGVMGPAGFAAPLVAALAFLGPAVVLNVFALVRAPRASQVERVTSIAVLVFTVCVLDGFYLNGLAWALTGRVAVFAGLPVFAGMALAFVAFVVYSRLGVRAEWRRARVK